MHGHVAAKPAQHLQRRGAVHRRPSRWPNNTSGDSVLIFVM
jgi:hypothetical protein